MYNYMYNYYNECKWNRHISFIKLTTLINSSIIVWHLFNNKLFNKNKPQLKHISFSMYTVCVYVLQTCWKSCVTLNILIATVKYYDELITMFAKCGCSKYEKLKKNLNSIITVRTLYVRCVRALNAP